MRGKNILWMSLIAMLLSVTIPNVGLAAPKPPLLPEVYMDPTGRFPGPGQLGHPGELYAFSIHVRNVVDLWAVQVSLEFAPLLSVLSPQDFAEGTFLADGWTNPPAADTAFFSIVDGLNGKLTVIILRTGSHSGDRWGATGEGLLATFNFNVVESGESFVRITECIMLDSDGQLITHTISPEEAYYYGTTASLIRVNLPEGKKVKAGTTFPISSKVRNDGDVPLYVKVRFYVERPEVPRMIEIYSGQTYGGGGIGEPLPFDWVYATDYIGGIEDGTWSNPGALVGEPDGVYSECTTAYGYTGYYLFDYDLAGRTILNADLFGYTRQPDDTSWDFDPYVDFYDDYGNYLGWAWADSMGGTAHWAWTGGRYYMGTTYDMPEYYMDLFGILPWRDEVWNNLELSIENYCPSGPRQQIDSVRWKLTFASITPVEAPIYTVMPGEELELGDVVWPSTPDHVGSYTVSASIEYSSELFSWNSMGSEPKTTFFWIVEP
jgi:hypothetical protein